MPDAMPTGLRTPMRAWANLPDAKGNAGVIFFCPDSPTGGRTLVVCDGVRWRPFARGVYVSRQTVASNGQAVFSYDTPFSKVPALSVTLTDISGLGKLTYFVSAESVSGCTIQVQRGVVLPTLASLVGFNSFAGGSMTGITVNLTAFPMP